jgi:hypothetical protein
MRPKPPKKNGGDQKGKTGSRSKLFDSNGGTCFQYVVTIIYILHGAGIVMWSLDCSYPVIQGNIEFTQGANQCLSGAFSKMRIGQLQRNDCGGLL